MVLYTFISFFSCYILYVFFLFYYIILLYITYVCTILYYSNDNLKLGETVEPVLDAFSQQTAIGNAYKSVLLHTTTLHNNTLFQLNTIEKLQSTINIYGYSYLSNNILEANRSNVLIKETGLKQALQLYILQTKNRFSKQSILLRKLLKLLCQYSTEENSNLLEALWKECISEYILEKYIQIQNTTTTTTGSNNNNNLIKNEKRKNSDKNSEIYMDNLINTLIKELNNIRYISKIDMSIIKNCNITTDLAFVIAFKRLSKEQSIELTKALVVRISTLIDTYKTQSMTRFWADEVEKITDFIQVGVENIVVCIHFVILLFI